MMKLNCLKKRKKNLSLDKILDSDSDLSLTYADEYDWLDKHAIESFMKNMLLGIAICIKNQKILKYHHNYQRTILLIVLNSM